MSEERFSFFKEAEQFSVVIRTQKNLWLILVPLLYFGVKIPHQLHRLNSIIKREQVFSNPDSSIWPFIILMGILMAASIAAAIVWLLWSLAGKEIVEVDPRSGQLKTHYWLGLRWFTKQYRLNQIKDIRTDIIHNPISSILKGGNIRFEYEGKTKRFGWTLVKKDADEICAALKPFLPEQVVQLIR